MSLLVNTVNIATIKNKIKNSLYCECLTILTALDAMNLKKPSSSSVIDNIDNESSNTIIFTGLIAESDVKASIK